MALNLVSICVLQSVLLNKWTFKNISNVYKNVNVDKKELFLLCLPQPASILYSCEPWAGTKEIKDAGIS